MSKTAEIGLEILRRVLENALSAEQAPKILFEALTLLPDDEDVPRSGRALASFVAGPLTTVLREKHGEAQASSIVESVTAALSSASIYPPPGPAPAADRDPNRPSIEVELPEDAGVPDDPYAHNRATLKLSTAAVRGDTLRVLIVSQKSRLARWIGAAFGGERVTAITASRIESCAENLHNFTPAIVIVDGRDAADIRPGDLATLLEGVSPEALTIVWSSDQPAGSARAAALAAGKTPFTAVPRSAGFEPMLDYVRARIG